LGDGERDDHSTHGLDGPGLRGAPPGGAPREPAPLHCRRAAAERCGQGAVVLMEPSDLVERLSPEAALPSRPLRVALAQMNPRVGDLDGNAARMVELIQTAREAGAQLVAFTELVVTG